MNFNVDNWRMSQEEQYKYCQQFLTLNPLNGFLTGQQARDFFLRIGLPQDMLAKIWTLSDLTCDGRLDRREFCIALHLMLKAKAGVPIPAVLPDSMKVEPTAFGYSSAPQTPSASGCPAPMMPPMSAYTMTHQMPMMGSAPPSVVPLVASGNKVDWSLSQATKLKFSQEFNAIDRSKSGFVSGVQARNILVQSGFPNQILAQIWTLADMDKDGRLSCDEFCVALFLIEKLKAGEVTSLPAALPHETISSLINRQRSSSVISNDGYLTPGPDEPLSVDNQFATTFEDKRKENFDRGQAELERRRLLLLEQEKRERDERDRKERVQAEKRERERLEIERKRQAELEKQMEVQRQEEARRDEEYRKLAEQREVARREMERQRMVEMEKHRLHELMVQRQREQEANCHLMQRQKTAKFQLQALSERSQELDTAVVGARDKIMLATATIEAMKLDRDSKMSDIESAKRQIQELNMAAAQTQLELRSTRAERDRSIATPPIEQSMQRLDDLRQQKTLNIDNLRNVLQAVRAEIEQKTPSAEHQAALANKRNVVEQGIRDETDLNRDLAAKVAQRQAKLMPMLQQQRKPSQISLGGAGVPAADGFDASGFSDDAWPSANPAPGESNATRKYKALYEFEARGEDELSFQPGDMVLVFEDHKGEPGWLAGQIKDKVGWFPEAFAEPLDSPLNGAAPTRDLVSPQLAASKLEPINEEPRDDDAAPRLMTSSKSNGAAMTSESMRAVAQFHWKGKKDDHLSFAKGDIVHVLEMQEMWWFGETADGNCGWFPKSYVRLSVDSVERRKSVDVSATHDEAGRDVKSLTRRFESLDFPAQSPRQPDRRQSQSSAGGISQVVSGAETGEWYRAIYPFPEMEPGDLQFEAGDDILVVERTSDAEWWTGICKGRCGIFPANYVQPLSEEEARCKALMAQKSKSLDKTPSTEIVSTPTSPGQHEACEIVKVIAPYKATGANQLSLETGDWIKIRSKSPTGWWEGELQQKKSVPGEKKVGWFPGNYVVAMDRKEALRSTQSSSAESVNSVIHVVPAVSASAGDQSSLLTVVAMFDYVAQQVDELSFARGQMLRVVEKPDDDWWTGETMDGSRRGLFPATYVQQCEGQTIR